MKPLQFVQESVASASPFLSFSRVSDAVRPGLCYLRVELSRARPGMTDFLIRCSTSSEQPAVVTVRGSKEFAGDPHLTALAKALAEQYARLGNNHFNWKELNTEHLVSMLGGPIRLFIKTPSVEVLGFSTDALR